MLELKDRLSSVDAAGKSVTPPESGASYDSLDRDELSALQNLGCTRPAEEALRKVKKRSQPKTFERYFRAALSLVR